MANCLDSVLLNTFVIRKNRCRVFLNNGYLTWEPENTPEARVKLPLKDIISVEYHDVQNNSTFLFKSKLLSNKKPDPLTFSVHYASQTSNNKWRHNCVSLKHADARKIVEWVKTIQGHLDSMSYRPKRLLLFINPYGGKKNALKIFEKYCEPLFSLAGIDTNVIISQRQDQIRDVVMTHSLEPFDAIACVGGDGTFSEVFNGLMLRSLREADTTGETIESFPQPKIPVGIIPGGSTDTVAYCLHGTTDVETAVIHILLGQTSGLDLASVSNNTGLIRFYASVMSYGYLGDVAKDSERYRCCGPKRYDYSGFKKFMSNRSYEGEITFLRSESDPKIGPKCVEDCERCVDMLCKDKLTDKSESAGNWTTVRGNFFMVNGANISCACARSPNGFSPFCHIGDGCVDLILVKHTSIFNNLRLLLKLSNKNKNIFDLPFVDVYRTQEIYFRPPASGSSKNSVWNCDGEMLEESEIRIRLFFQCSLPASSSIQEESRRIIGKGHIHLGC